MNEVDHNVIKLKLFPFLLRTKREVGSIIYLLVLSTRGEKWLRRFLGSSFHPISLLTSGLKLHNSGKVIKKPCMMLGKGLEKC